MEPQLKYQFVSHYYDDIYGFTSRILNFVRNYYNMIFDEGIVFGRQKLDEMGKSEVIFGEMIPYFFNHNEIKNFNLSGEKPMDELISEIEDYILSLREQISKGSRDTIIISLNHNLDDSIPPSIDLTEIK